MEIINKTISEYVEEQKQEILKEDASIWSNNLVTELKQEYFNMIIEELNKGNKITQEAYNNLISDNFNTATEWYLNKHFLIHGIKITA